MFSPFPLAKFIQTKKPVHISVSRFYKRIQLSRCFKIMPENMYELKALSSFDMFMYVVGTHYLIVILC